MKLSIRLDNNNFVSSFNINSTFHCLESISIDGISYNIVIQLLSNLIHLPRLSSLCMDIWNASNNCNHIYQLILLLPNLKFNKLTLDEDDSSISLPLANDQQYSSIEYLIIDHSCTFNELFIILSYVPKIHYLKFFIMNNVDGTVHTVLPITLSQLTQILVEICYTDFNSFEVFIRKIYCKLKFLYILIKSEDISFLNARRWEQLINELFPDLRSFYLKYYENMKNEHDSVYPGETNDFISLFWTERHWVFEAKVNFDRFIIYTVCPYKYIEKNFFISKRLYFNYVLGKDGIIIYMKRLWTNPLI
jgi:hypothetical protein